MARDCRVKHAYKSTPDLSFQPHPTENTWNDKEPAQVKVRHTVRALPGALHKRTEGGIPGVFGIFPLASQNGEELGAGS